MNAVPWMRRPLARRLFAAVFATAIPLIVIGVILFVFWFNQRRSLVLIGNFQQARLGAAFVSGWVDGNLRTLVTIAASAEVRSGKLKEIRGIIDRQVHAQPAWEDLFVTDAQGKIIASHIHSGISVAERAYFQTAQQTGKPTVSNLLGWVGEAISDPELVPQALQVIRRNAEIQQRMLENLLEISRLIHGKLALRLDRLELWQLAERVASEMQLLATERKITITLVPPTEALPIQADRKRMAEVISNLLDNAIKYTSPGGTVSITAYQDGDMAALSVEDRGRGFSPEELPTLFELFFLPPGEDANRGLHLGLALAKSIMELHGGRIIARSPGLGKGSTFTIELPLAPAPEGCPSS